MLRTPRFDGLVNPYVRLVREHPRHLLPEPDPRQLAQARGESPVPGQRLILDLGCGAGNFLRRMAQAQPQDHFVGFELRFKRLVLGARKLEKRQLNNVWLLREAAERFADYVPAGSVAGVYLNFPDPWPKYAHWKKRMVQPAFLQALARALRPDGFFLLKTDHSGYFLHVLSLVGRTPGWRIAGFSNDLARNPVPGAEVPTEFEELFRTQSKPTFALRLQHTAPSHATVDAVVPAHDPAG